MFNLTRNTILNGILPQSLFLMYCIGEMMFMETKFPKIQSFIKLVDADDLDFNINSKNNSNFTVNFSNLTAINFMAKTATVSFTDSKGSVRLQRVKF